MKIAIPYENGQVFQHFGHSAQFKLYTAEEGRITGAEVVSTDGQGHGALVGFLAQHENCVTPVEVGEMRIKDTQGKIIHAFVGSGFLEFVNNEATLVCVSAELPNEIDARRAKEAKERAEEEMRQHHSQMEYHHSQANLARAMERLRVVKRYPR